MKTASIRYTSKGHRVKVRIPPSPTPSTTLWSLDTPEQEEGDDDDLSFVGSERKHSSEDEESSDEDREELSDDGDMFKYDDDEEYSSAHGEESSDEDGEKFDGDIPGEEVVSLLIDAKKLSAPIPIPYLKAERKRHQRELLAAKELHEASQKTVEALRKDISVLTSKIDETTTENSSLKEGQEATENHVAKERKRYHLDLERRYEGSQKVVEALRKEVDALNSFIDELKTKESSLSNSLEVTQDALEKERALRHELEIRLNERVVLGIKTQDSFETKLEKYLREELEKSQSRVLQEQHEFKELQNDHARLRVTYATLESHVKYIEAVKDEHISAAKRDSEELAEKNSDLSSQLLHTRAEFERLKAALAAVEKENEGGASKSTFSLSNIYRRAKYEPSSH
jgi:DNA repair exonuclease SbcCD ATPase subunit